MPMMKACVSVTVARASFAVVQSLSIEETSSKLAEDLMKADGSLTLNGWPFPRARVLQRGRDKKHI